MSTPNILQWRPHPAEALGQQLADEHARIEADMLADEMPEALPAGSFLAQAHAATVARRKEAEANARRERLAYMEARRDVQRELGALCPTSTRFKRVYSAAWRWGVVCGMPLGGIATAAAIELGRMLG